MRCVLLFVVAVFLASLDRATEAGRIIRSQNSCDCFNCKCIHYTRCRNTDVVPFKHCPANNVFVCCKHRHGTTDNSVPHLKYHIQH